MHIEHTRCPPLLEKEASPLKSLPAELLCCILRKLDEESLFNLSQSCKEMRALLLQVPEGGGLLRKIARLYFATLHSERIVSDFEVFARLTEEMKEHGKRIKSLELEGSLSGDSKLLVRLCPELEKLNLCGELSLKELEGLKALKELTYESETEEPFDLEKFPQTLASRLESLTLKNLKPVYMERFVLKSFLSHSLYCLLEEDEEESPSLSSSVFENLKVLEVETASELETDTLQELVKRSPNLKRLKLSKLKKRDLKEKGFLKSLKSSRVKTLHIGKLISRISLFYLASCSEEERALCKELFQKTELKRIILGDTSFTLDFRHSSRLS